jgi:hypothetical protein
MMRRVRVMLLALAALITLPWAFSAWMVQTARMEHRTTLAGLRSLTLPTNEAEIASAIATYERARRLSFCHSSLLRDLNLLYAAQAERALADDDLDAEDTALTKLQATLTRLTRCKPGDGKAWLDQAILYAYREGAGPEAFAAYRMSGSVTPAESWLAKKRLLFILPYASLIDPQTRQTIVQDMNTLPSAHPNHLSEVMKAADVTTPEALRALLGLDAAAKPAP